MLKRTGQKCFAPYACPQSGLSAGFLRFDSRNRVAIAVWPLLGHGGHLRCGFDKACPRRGTCHERALLPRHQKGFGASLRFHRLCGGRVPNPNNETAEKILEFARIAVAGRSGEVGNGVFRWWLNFSSDDENGVVTLTSLYQKIFFIGATVLAENVPNQPDLATAEARLSPPLPCA